MADPRIFMNADGSMKIDIDPDDDGTESSDEDTSDENDVLALPAVGFDDVATASIVEAGTDEESIASVHVQVLDDTIASNSYIMDYSIQAVDTISAADHKGEESTDMNLDGVVPEDHTRTMGELKEKDYLDQQPSTRMLAPGPLAEMPTEEVQQQSAPTEMKIASAGATKGPPLGLSLSSKKRTSRSPGFSILKRRKLPLKRNKMSLTPMESNASLRQGQGGVNIDNETTVEATIVTDPSQYNKDEVVEAVPMEITSETNKTSTSPSNTTKLKKFKPSMARPTLATPSIVSEKRILLHAGPADDLPPGWTIKHYKRTTGLKHTDRYWFSPLLKKKFRSLAQVGRFLDFLQKEKGDETKAWESFRSSPPGPDEVRSRSRMTGERGERKKSTNNKYGILSGIGGSIHSTSNGVHDSFDSKNNTNKNSSSTNTNNIVSRAWSLPLIPSPGLMMMPSPSLLQRYQKEQEAERIGRRNFPGCGGNKDDNNDDFKTDPIDSKSRQHNGPKLELNDKGYITPSLLFDHALHAAGYTREKLADAKHFGSSIVRTVDDIFDSNVALENIEFVPTEVWNRTVSDSHSGEESDSPILEPERLKNTFNASDVEANNSRSTEKRLAKDLLKEQLQQLLNKSPRKICSPYTFEDMIPRSLTSSIPESFGNAMRDYVLTVGQRESALETYHAQKKVNEDALDAYEDAMDEWRSKVASYERKKARKEAKKAAESQPAEETELDEFDQNRIQNDRKDGVRNVEVGINAVNDGVPKEELPTNAIKSSTQEKEATENSVPKESEGVGPEPDPPILSELIKVNAIPIPPTMPMDRETEIESTDDQINTSATKYDIHILKSKCHLVSHLDPASFRNRGRYHGLLSNSIADPQFVGPNAPGISGVNNMIITGLSATISNVQSNEEYTTKEPSSKTIKKVSNSSKNVINKSKSKKGATGVGPTPTSTAMQLKKMMDKGDSTTDIIRDSIIKAAVYASRTGVHSGSFVAKGETYPDISKAFSNHAKCRPCARCKNNKQGAYHCRLKRKHTDRDHDGGSSYKILAPLFEAPLESISSTD